jgi:hypothetical protein
MIVFPTASARSDAQQEIITMKKTLVAMLIAVSALVVGFAINSDAKTSGGGGGMGTGTGMGTGGGMGTGTGMGTGMGTQKIQ